MGASGAVVMGFFGALFASLTLLLQLGLTGTALAWPFVPFVAILVAARVVMRAPGTFAKPEGSGRVIMWSSVGEGGALFVVNEVLINLGRSELVLPAMAMIVGLHFVPIARYAPFPPLYALALAMVAVGIAGLLLTQPLGGTLAGFAASGTLASASIAALRREWSSKAQSRD